MSKSHLQFLKADHQHQVSLSNNMQFLLKKLFLTVCKEEKTIESQRQVLAKLQDFDPCLSFNNFSNKSTNLISSVDMHKYLRNYGLDEINEGDCEIIVNYFSSRQDGYMDQQDFLQMLLPCDNAKLRRKIEKKPKYLVSKDMHMTREVELELTKLLELEIAFNRKCENIKQRIHSCKEFTEEKAFLSIDDWNYGYIDKKNIIVQQTKAIFQRQQEEWTQMEMLDFQSKNSMMQQDRLLLSASYQLDKKKRNLDISILNIKDKRRRHSILLAVKYQDLFLTDMMSQSRQVTINQSIFQYTIQFNKRQMDTVRTMANDRQVTNRGSQRMSASPLKRRPIIDKNELKNATSQNNSFIDQSYRSRSITNVSQIQNQRRFRTPNKTPQRNSSQNRQNTSILKKSILKTSNNKRTPIQLYTNNTMYTENNDNTQNSLFNKEEDFGFKPTKQENQLLKELEAKFLNAKKQNSSSQKHRFRHGNEVEAIHSHRSNIQNQHSLLKSIQDDPQELYNQNIQNNLSNFKQQDSRMNSTFHGDQSTITSSPLRIKSLTFNGDQYSHNISDIKEGYSPLQHSVISYTNNNNYNNDYQQHDYHSLRGNRHHTNNSRYNNDTSLNISTISKQSPHIDRLLQDDFEQKHYICRQFQEFIYMEQQAEVLKIKLALKQDFSLIDAFGLLDSRAKGQVDSIELREQLYNLSGIRYTLEDIDLVLKRYQNKTNVNNFPNSYQIINNNKNILKYSDFTRIFMPIDEYYAKMQSVKRVQYPLNSSRQNQSHIDERESVGLFLKLWDLIICNERTAENIKRDISARYRLNMRGLFNMIDYERDGYITYSEISNVFRECNKHLSISDYEYLRNRLDHDADGKISYEEVSNDQNKCY